jgi:hypothetical protein
VGRLSEFVVSDGGIDPAPTGNMGVS